MDGRQRVFALAPDSGGRVERADVEAVRAQALAALQAAISRQVLEDGFRSTVSQEPHSTAA